MTAKEFLKDYRTDNKKKKRVLIHLFENKGLITTACQKVGMHRATFYDWKKSDPEFTKWVNTINDLEVEKVRSKLSELIDDNNTAAIIFYLKSKSKEFKNKVEVKGDVGISGVSINIVNPNE